MKTKAVKDLEISREVQQETIHEILEILKRHEAEIEILKIKHGILNFSSGVNDLLINHIPKTTTVIKDGICFWYCEKEGKCFVNARKIDKNVSSGKDMVMEEVYTDIYFSKIHEIK